MAHYLLEVSYTPEAWAVMLKNPQDRAQAIEGAIKKLGGSVERFWMAFGKYDIIGVINMPDNVAAAAFAMSVAAGGACKDIKTTPLLAVQDGLEAMKKAAACGYKSVTAS